MKQSKILFSSFFEGHRVCIRIQTKTNWESFFITGGISICRGFRGTYKNRTVVYKEYCPPGFVRHHKYYNDKDINEGVEIITLEEHMLIHDNLGY